MSDSVFIYASIWGNGFSPSRLQESNPRIVYSRKDPMETHEPGEISLIGKNKGKPRPYGSAVIISNKQNYLDQLLEIVSVLESSISTIRSLGGTNIELKCAAYFSDSFEFTLEPILVNRIANLGIDVSFSGYIDHDGAS